MAKIRMCDMEFYGYTGCLPEEKKQGQTFIVTVEMDCEDLVGCISDRLEDTVDYSKVYDIVKNIVESSHCNLIEHLCFSIARELLDSSDLITEVKVTVSKPNAPVNGKFRTMETEVILRA